MSTASNNSPAHYITNRDGCFYRGTVYGGSADWTCDRREAFAYTNIDVAIEKIDRFPAMFEGCHVATF